MTLANSSYALLAAFYISTQTAIIFMVGRVNHQYVSERLAPVFYYVIYELCRFKRSLLS